MRLAGYLAVQASAAPRILRHQAVGTNDDHGAALALTIPHRSRFAWDLRIVGRAIDHRQSRENTPC